MNDAQKRLYFFEWGQVRRHYIGRGIDPKQADAKRHELHRSALGFDKSSSKFTNSDLDKVLGAFKAVYDGGNLNAQLEQNDQADQRKRAYITRIGALGYYLVTEKTLAKSYVQGMAQRMFGTGQLAKLEEDHLRKLENVIVARVRNLHPAERVRFIVQEAKKHAEKMGKITAPAAAGACPDPF